MGQKYGVLAAPTGKIFKDGGEPPFEKKIAVKPRGDSGFRGAF